MKRFYSTLLALAGSFAALAQSPEAAKPQLSAGTMQYLYKLEHGLLGPRGVSPNYVYRQDAAHTTYLSALIKVSPGFQASALSAIGANVGTKAKDIWTVQVPLHQVKAFTELPGILYIEVDQPTHVALDTARRMTRVDSVHMGYNLPHAFNGKDVVVGIVDYGFDYRHPTLYDTSYTHYRVKRVWEEKNNTGTPPTGFTYGSEFTDSLSITTKGHDTNQASHGTHVAGIVGGSGVGGLGNARRFRGMAYASDLVLVGILPDLSYWLNTGMADFLDGMNYVYNYAASVGKPAVVNLSWGNPLGPRDGSSLFSQACDNLVGPGKIFVLSGGNNGQNSIHLQKTFTGTDTLVGAVCSFPSGLPTKVNWIDVWGEPGKSFCIQLSLYNLATKIDSAYICLDNTTHQVHLKSNNGDTCFVTLTAVASEFNGKPHMLLDVFSRAASSNRLTMSLRGTSGTVNAWTGYVLSGSGYYGAFGSGGFAWASNGDSKLTCSDIASTKLAIAVGSYNSKTGFTNVSGQSQSYTGYIKGALSLFSSKGPTADGRTKPNITGPGLAVASAINSSDPDFASGGADYNAVVSTYTSPVNGQTYSYAMLAGTSMAGPAVAGIVGLMLEADPHLEPFNAMQILNITAIQDNFTGVITNPGSNDWGYGKVNAYRALLMTLQTVGIYHQDMSLDFVLYPNPGNGLYSVLYNSTASETLHMQVYDVMGREVLHNQWAIKNGENRQSIDLSSAPAGIYFAKIAGEKGSGTVKIIKQ